MDELSMLRLAVRALMNVLFLLKFFALGLLFVLLILAGTDAAPPVMWPRVALGGLFLIAYLATLYHAKEKKE